MFRFLILFLLISSNLFSQGKYWIFFNKNLSNLSNSEKEIKLFLDSSKINICQKSNWLNAVSANLNTEQLSILSNNKSILKIEKMNGYFFPTKKSDDQNFEIVMNQIGAKYFKEANLNGKGVKIGIVDAGFYEANIDPFLAQVFKNNQIIEVKDFLNPLKTQHFNESETSLDYHGAEVLSCIAGFDSTTNTTKGLASKALFYLARTDHGKREERIEEDNWIAAIEWFHSKGVRLINSSLGYADGFTNPDENYFPEQMDGKTSRISQFANFAVKEKGMFIVSSAGNEGDNTNWKVLSTPADAQEVFSIGATTGSGSKIGYSSIGSENISYIKPNVSCYSLNGTSFSAPAITGLVACILQLDSTLTNKEIFSIIEQSSNLYPFGNNYVGYGVPNLKNILSIIKKEPLNSERKKIKVKEDNYIIEFEETNNQPIVVYHKKDKINVILQKVSKSNSTIFEVKRIKNAKFTTVDLKTLGVYEIEWLN